MTTVAGRRHDFSLADHLHDYHVRTPELFRSHVAAAFTRDGVTEPVVWALRGYANGAMPAFNWADVDEVLRSEAAKRNVTLPESWLQLFPGPNAFPTEGAS